MSNPTDSNDQPETRDDRETNFQPENELENQPEADGPVTHVRAPSPRDRFAEEIAARKQADLDEHEDEEKIWAGGYSPKAMVGSWIVVAAASVGLLVAAVMIDQFQVLWAIGLIVLLWIVTAIIYAWRRLGYHYELTTQRFIHQSGILSRHTDRIEVIDIDDVSFRQGPIQRLLGIGNIELTSSDRSHPKLAMMGIANVRDVSGQIDDIRRKERRRRSLHIEAI